MIQSHGSMAHNYGAVRGARSRNPHVAQRHGNKVPPPPFYEVYLHDRTKKGEEMWGNCGLLVMLCRMGGFRMSVWVNMR